jgi:hypothetical protein
MSCDPLRVAGGHFKDVSGRSVILRGVNLGGDCKVPYPYGGTNFSSDFSDHRTVSFIGRPFDLAEAGEHLSRLAHWGFNTLRLLTTWEAIAHAGPGLIDEEYLDFLVEICRRANDHGLYVMIDFHEDVWSRMTGGSGAPGWTFEAVGLDFTKFHAAGASHVMQNKFDYARGGWQAAYPQMSWGSNHRLPPTGIMWTLFFTGRLFTPEFKIGGRNVQDYLQGEYLGAMAAVAKRVRDLPNVIGFDTLNEPVHGWIERPMSYRHVEQSAQYPVRPRIGLATSPLDCLLAARGLSVTVPVVTRDNDSGAQSVTREEILNPDRISIWAEGWACPFEAAGAYRVEGERVVDVNESFFRSNGARTFTAAEDAYRPLFDAVASTVREENPDWAIFAEIEPYTALSGKGFPSCMPERSVNASHWYDFSTLYTKRFSTESALDFSTGEVAHGRDELLAQYCRQLTLVKNHAERFSPDGAPTLIGEFGIPYDLEHGAAFDAWRAGDRSDTPWSMHIDALSLMYDAMDALHLHSTQWNYTASNRNDLMIGDGWNQEDLSIFSEDQRIDPADPDSGGRAVAGFCRPYVRRTSGKLLSMAFDREAARFEARIKGDPVALAATEIYLPRLHFGTSPAIQVRGTEAIVCYDPKAQIATIEATRAEVYTVTIAASGKPG